MLMQNLRGYSNNYSKTSGSFWQYYRYKLALTDAGVINNILDNSTSFKFKEKIKGKTVNDGTNVEMMIPLRFSVILGERLKCH